MTELDDADMLSEGGVVQQRADEAGDGESPAGPLGSSIDEPENS
jgi:hypothetical protein